MRTSRDKRGYATVTGPRGVHESDSVTCKHCGRAWWVTSTDPHVKTDPGGWCRLCMAPICATCVDKPCLPLEQRLTQYERRAALFRSMGL